MFSAVLVRIRVRVIYIQLLGNIATKYHHLHPHRLRSELTMIVVNHYGQLYILDSSHALPGFR